MGLGGHMMWTAVAREIVETYKEQHGDFKILPVSNNTLVRSEIFKNNPYFTYNQKEPHFIMDLSNPDTNYCIREEPYRAIHRNDKHVIEQVCEFYKIANPSLKCELYLTDEENAKVDNILEGIGDFIAIEPHAKNSYTVNKEYSFEKWQSVVDSLKDEVQFVQIGVPSKKTLKNVIDFTGKTSYRETYRVIEKSLLFVGIEGGLMHVANSCGKKSVIVVPGFLHPDTFCYPENINIQVCSYCEKNGPCGYTSKVCDDGKNEVKKHNEDIIVSSIREVMKENEGISNGS